MQPQIHSVIVDRDDDSAVPCMIGTVLGQKHLDSSTSTSKSFQKSPTSKRNGASAIPHQVFIPDEKFLSCRDFYTAKGNDTRRFCAMMIGVSKEVHGIELSMQDEPILSFRREMRPTNIILQEELLRRALLCKARILPRPSQWERDKILAHLKDVYPPQLTEDDLEFLSERLECLLEYYTSKKEQQLAMNKGKENGWSMMNTHLRFYHSLIEAKKTTAAPFESEEFWRTVATWMNDKTWVPNSLEMPHIDDEFQQRRQLLLQLNDSVSWEILRSRFYKLRKTLTLCHPGESFDSQTTPRSHPRLSPRVLYFLTFLYSCGLDREDFKLPNTSMQIPFPISDNTSSNVCSTTVYVEQANHHESSQSPQDTNEGHALLPDDSVTSVEPSATEMPTVATSTHMPVRAVTMEPSSLSPSFHHFPDKSDAKHFLESSKLYLHHMDCYIRLEKELFEMEERRVALMDNSLTKDPNDSSDTAKYSPSNSLAKVYEATCERKKESLNDLKRRMCELEYVSDLLSKRMRSNEA